MGPAGESDLEHSLHPRVNTEIRAVRVTEAASKADVSPQPALLMWKGANMTGEEPLTEPKIFICPSSADGLFVFFLLSPKRTPFLSFFSMQRDVRPPGSRRRTHAGRVGITRGKRCSVREMSGGKTGAARSSSSRVSLLSFQSLALRGGGYATGMVSSYFYLQIRVGLLRNVVRLAVLVCGRMNEKEPCRTQKTADFLR